jgi:alginate O-acetyltransferase complex protein AlgI
MLFNSQVYLAFLPAVFVVTWLLRPRWRPAFLLLASYGFYAYWNPPFIVLIGAMTAANYLLGLVQGRRVPRSRALLIAALGLDLAILSVFKYLGLLDESVRRLAHLFGLDPGSSIIHLILPLGLSFFTFEFIHYQVDLFRGHQPVRDPVRFALFPSFFPTQIAGPIKRYQDFDAQVRAQPRFDPRLALEGVELIALGLFKKVALADTLLPIVGLIFDKPYAWGWGDRWIGLLAFAFQIYLDFSGYTDIGRGSAQLLGYRIPINFRRPYLATSARDFWRRWHISLSSWLRDYLYIPLGGSRGSPWRTRLNLMITMGLGGLWHGAAWHFLVWGLGHGTALAVNRAWQTKVSRPKRVPPWVGILAGWALTQAGVLFLWGLFRAPTVGDSMHLFSRLFDFHSSNYLPVDVSRTVLLIAGGIMVAQLARQRWDPRALLERQSWSVLVRPAYVLVLGAFATYFGIVNGLPHRFIYFQF